MRGIRGIAALLILAAGCATAPKAFWVPAEGNYKTESMGFSADLPAGWTRLNTDKSLMLTRDGMSLQSIGADRFKIGEPLKYTKKAFDNKMLPQEVAALLIDEMSSMEGVTSSEVLENVPARFGGLDGFRVVFRYRLKNGLTRKCTVYGGMYGDWVYWLYYYAAARYYFDRDREAFESMVRSFRLAPLPQPAGAPR